MARKISWKMFEKYCQKSVLFFRMAAMICWKVKIIGHLHNTDRKKLFRGHYICYKTFWIARNLPEIIQKYAENFREIAGNHFSYCGKLWCIFYIKLCPLLIINFSSLKLWLVHRNVNYGESEVYRCILIFFKDQ